MTTAELRKNHELSRKDAVKCNKMGGDVGAYKSTPEYQERAKRRAKQGNGLDAKPKWEGWVAPWCKTEEDANKAKSLGR
ncbi:MAG: hypothetical protein RL662_2378 [Bacteroidota bacterium]|jgi:hypothetical protein